METNVGSGSGSGNGNQQQGVGQGHFKEAGKATPLMAKLKGQGNGIKIVLLGEMSCGKTSVVSRYVKNTFGKVETTVGAAFLMHKVTIGNYTVKLEIWDTAGQERYKSLAPMYYRGADAAVIVYDITNKTSFDTMRQWIEELKARASPNIVFAIAGNKCDLESERQVPLEMAQEYLRQLEAAGDDRPVFTECSAKSGDFVDKIFTDLIQKLITLAENGRM